MLWQTRRSQVAAARAQVEDARWDRRLVAVDRHCRIRAVSERRSSLLPARVVAGLPCVGMREMTLYGVSFEPIGKQPIVLLKTLDEDRFLPIWIGHAEAAAILMKLQGSNPPRPMTHDLLTDVVSELKGEIVRVTVTELRENTYFAKITIVQDGNEFEIDSRPSDAIALAVRCEAQIFAADDVVDESGIEFQGGDDEQVSLVTASNLADLDPEEFRRFIETVTPEEFASSLEEALDELEDDVPDEEDDR